MKCFFSEKIWKIFTCTVKASNVWPSYQQERCDAASLFILFIKIKVRIHSQPDIILKLNKDN